MHNLVQMLLRILAGIVGAFLLYIAFFLYEDEENRIQNRLEEIWQRVNALQSRVMSKEVAFVTEATRTTNAILDRIFGEKLISMQFVAVCAAYSFGSFLSFQVLWGLVHSSGFLLESDGIIMMSEALLLLVLGSLPALAVLGRLLIRGKKWYCAGLIILVCCFSVLWDLELPPKWTFTIVEFLSLDVLIIPLGVLTDILCILLFRWILKRVAGLSSIWTISSCLTAAAVAMLLLIGPALSALFGFGRRTETFVPDLGLVPQMSASNFVDAACLLLFIIVMALLLAHRLVWPMIKRPLYAANRKGLIKNSKLLGALGTMLFIYAFPNNPIIKWLTEFLPKVKG